MGQIIIEQASNGFIVVVVTEKGRKVVLFSNGPDVVSLVKDIVDPSPIAVPPQELTVVKS
jgi:hypothetical protein